MMILSCEDFKQKNMSLLTVFWKHFFFFHTFQYWEFEKMSFIVIKMMSQCKNYNGVFMQNKFKQDSHLF